MSLLLTLIWLTICGGFVWEAFAEWAESPPTQRSFGAASKKIHKLWFWLTCHKDCAWCKRRVHEAWMPLRFRMPSGKVPRVSHTICPSCVQKVESKVELSVEREARRMAEIRDRLKEKISQEIYSKRHALTNNH